MGEKLPETLASFFKRSRSNWVKKRIFSFLKTRPLKYCLRADTSSVSRPLKTLKKALFELILKMCEEVTLYPIMLRVIYISINFDVLLGGRGILGRLQRL